MDKIPQDVWPLIASFLDDKTKIQMRLASTKWFNIIKYNNFKIYFARSENIQAISERLSKYSWPIELHFFKSKFSRPLDLINALPKITNITKISTYSDFGEITEDQWLQLSTLTNITDWKLGEDHVPIKLWEKLTKLTEFSRPELSWTDLAPVIKRMKNLDSFSAYDDGTNTWPFAFTYNPDKLTKLSVTMTAKMEHGSEMWSHLTNLKELEYFDEDDNEIELYMTYLTALEYFSINDTFLPPLTANTNLTNLIFFVTEWLESNAGEISNLTKLRALEIDINYEGHEDEEEEVERDPINLHFLSNLVQLKECSLSINSAEEEDQKIGENSCKYLPRSIKQLTFRLNLDLGVITHLTNLESLYSIYKAHNVHNLTLLSKLTCLMFYQHDSDLDLRSIGKLTQLIDLDLDCSEQDQKSLDNLPDLSMLVNLKVLRWQLSGAIPLKKIENLKYLTSLEELDLQTGEKSIKNCEFISKLTNLTALMVNFKTKNHDSFWRGLAPLTSIKRLTLNHVDNERRLSTLTAFKNLTELTIQKVGENFTGVHFTTLTNLQSIIYYPDPANLVHKEEDLMKKLPYLARFT